MTLTTSLSFIHQSALEKETENLAFTEYLKVRNSEEVDAAVQQLNKAIEPQIDCTQCGNCCKSLMVNITNEEADRAAAHLHMSRISFDETYVEKGSHELMIMNRMPCAFLSNNACTIYEHRFAGCREFPALHLPEFNKRLFTVMMHYDRCPIIYNVMEALKETTGFSAVA
ncbi:MAG: YkgJ family cysteine cluster protein [Lacibacter sp.]